MNETVVGRPQLSVDRNGNVTMTATGWHEGGHAWLSTWDPTDPEGAWAEPTDLAGGSEPVHYVTSIHTAEGDLAVSWVTDSGQTETLVETTAISGIKFHDQDADGVRDPAEPGLSGWTIYLDEDGDGEFDAGETATVTDADGAYRFDSLEPGTYIVREENQVGWQRTSPESGYFEFELEAGDKVEGLDFGNVEPSIQLIDPPAQIGEYTVGFYDTDPANGITNAWIALSPEEFVYGMHDVLLIPGYGANAGTIVLFDGAGGTEDLGIAIAGNDRLDSVIDERAMPVPLGFLASQGDVGYVNLRAGIRGAHLNGQDLVGGWPVPDDVDGDGDFGDLTGLVSWDGMEALIVGGDIEGDLVAEFFGYLQVTGSGLHGDLAAQKSIGTIIIDSGDVTGRIKGRSLQTLQANGGDITGGVWIEETIGDVLALGGSVSGPVSSESGALGMVMAQAEWDPVLNGWAGGNVSGPVSAARGIGNVFAFGGDLTGDLNSGASGIGSVLAISNYDHVQDQEVGGTLSGSVSAGGDLGDLVGRIISAGVAVSGQVQNIAALEAMTGSNIVVTNGGVNSIAVLGATEDSSLALQDTMGRPDQWLNNFFVQGPFRNSSISARGAGSITVLGDMTGGTVAAADWSIGSVSVMGRTENSSILIRDDEGDLDGYLGSFYTERGLHGSTVGAAGMANVTVLGDMTSSTVRAANLGLESVAVIGRTENSVISLQDGSETLTGHLGSFYGQGDLYNSRIEARTLGSVVVGGRISENDDDGDTDVIHAAEGRFFAMDATSSALVEADGDHWFSEGEADQLRAYVGAEA
jgi:hypothetical protein